MSERKSSFIKVDELLPQVSVEQAANYYGITLPEMRRVGDEIRMRCFLACGRSEETGDRAIAVQADNPVKPWKCHVYQCQKVGNLVGLCDLMAPGTNAGGKPRGERFKQIAADLVAMTRGEQLSEADRSAAARPEMVKQAADKEPDINVPLAGSENERARELVNLDQQFVTDVAAMPPEASAYFRRRPFLTPEVCQKFAMGYLPHSAKSLLRGQIVYGYRSPRGELLTWFGRNIRFEEQLKHWKASDRSETEPIKTRFVKGFHRGLELYGDDIVRMEVLRGSRANLLIVEGPNDAIRLNTLDVAAVALCSNTITKEQVERIAALVDDLGFGCVTLMLDNDEEGILGTHQVLPLLAEKVPVLKIGDLMGSVVVPFLPLKTEEDYEKLVELGKTIVDFFAENALEHERTGEMIERIGLVNFLEGIGLDVDANMVSAPRTNPYVRSDGWDEEVAKIKAKKAAA